ncbi:hypothetical protein Dimus_007621, partial [Dionaea muscipula]
MTQIGQLANQNSNRPPGALHSNTETNPRDVKAITLRSGASYPEPRESHVLANSESSTSRPSKKRKIKRSKSKKGVDAEPESKKNSAPGTTKELNIPNTELPRPDLVSTSGNRNFVPTKKKEEDLNEANSVEEDSTLTSKEENFLDQNLAEAAPVVIYNHEAVREIEHMTRLAPRQEKEA